MTVHNEKISRIAENKIIVRAFAVGFSTLDKEKRSIMATLATENPVMIYDWESARYINEILLSDGFEFSEQIPLLDSHSRWSVKDQLGSVREISIQNKELVGRAFFAKTNDANEAFSKVEERHLTDLSIGYITARSVMVNDGDEYKHADGRIFKGPVKLSLKTIVKECSVTPIGADEMSKFRAANNDSLSKFAILEKENRDLKESLESARYTIRLLSITNINKGVTHEYA